LEDEVPIEKLPLLIVATLTSHDMSRVLIDEGSSFDIMYEELFYKLKLNKSTCHPTLEGL
jgi:hypothetical protein